MKTSLIVVAFLTLTSVASAAPKTLIQYNWNDFSSSRLFSSITECLIKSNGVAYRSIRKTTPESAIVPARSESAIVYTTEIPNMPALKQMIESAESDATYYTYDVKPDERFKSEQILFANPKSGIQLILRKDKAGYTEKENTSTAAKLLMKLAGNNCYIRNY